MIRLVRVVVLVVIWVALWGDPSPANLLSGLALAVAIVVLFDTWRAAPVVVRPLRAAHFAVHFTAHQLRRAWARRRPSPAPAPEPARPSAPG